jgi:hypothetical protein
MSRIAGAKDRVMIVESAIEPRTLDRFRILVEQCIEEWRVADMKLFGGYADDWTYKSVAESPQRDLPYILCNSVM